MLFGTADFVDALDVTGYLGLGGDPTIELVESAAASDITTAGEMSDFQFRHEGGEDVVFTVVVDGADTLSTCTTDTSGTCSVAGPVSVTAGQTISIKVGHDGTGPLEDVRWSATFAGPTAVAP